MPNIVEILVTAKDISRQGFDHAERGMHGLGMAAVAMGATVGAALVGIGVKSLEMASNFDSEMMKLTTQAGVAKDKLAGLKKGVLDLAGQVGQSPDSLAEALFHVESNFASLGITSEKAMELLKVAAQGASVGGADLVDVTNALTAAVASGIPGVEDFNKAMGVLNATVGAGDMTMQDLAKAMGTGFLATVKGFGLSIADVGAALATFGDNNIRGAKAGTQLRMAVQSLAAPAGTATQWLKKFGMSTDTLAKDMASGGLLKALADLKDRMDKAGIGAKEQGQILVDMFGKKAGVGVAILIDQFDRLKSKYPDLEKGANNFAEAWKNTKETLKQQWSEIKAGFEALMIRIGEKLTPVAVAGIAGIRKEGDRFLKWLKSTGIGEELKKLFSGFKYNEDLKKIGADAKKLGEEIKKNWPEIKQLVWAVAGAVGLVLKAFLKLLDFVIKMDTIMVGIWAGIIDGIDKIARAMVGVIKAIADGAAKIPGPWQKSMKESAKNIDDWAKAVQKTIDGIHGKDVAINPYLTHQTLNVRVTQTFGAAQRASGGIVSGMGAASGRLAEGMTLVGEQGPELVDLPSGSQVIPAGTTRNMLSEAQGGKGGVMQVQLVASSGSANAVATMINELIRTRKLQLKVVNGQVATTMS